MAPTVAEVGAAKQKALAALEKQLESRDPDTVRKAAEILLAWRP